jgi:cell volume regulation protein A
VTEITDFGVIVLLVAAGVFAAVAMSKVGTAFPLPGPAIFLLAAAIASDVFSGLGVLSIETASRIAVVALIIILFEGGMHVGWRSFRRSGAEITALGVLGTFGTAVLVALFAHTLLGVSWTVAGILGAALAPTDPAVMFSVLGKREISGRTGTILEGESGVNDPVAIALMIGMLEYATSDGASSSSLIGEFALAMAVGLAIGVAGAFVLREAMRKIDLPNTALYPLLALSGAGIIYGTASVAHGSGFLAVFVAGVLVGDERAPHKGEVERFHKSVASLAEIAVFVALGLTISLEDLGTDHVWLDALVLSLVLALVVRPLVVGLLVVPMRLTRGERLFVMWGGLRGAVPILLGTFAVIEGVDDADRIYQIVFVVVAFSVVVQGTSIPFVAPRLGIPMRIADPGGTIRCTVAEGSHAAGRAIRDLPLSERTWVQEVLRKGQLVAAHGDTVLEPGDEVVLILDVADVERLGRLFGGSR